MNDCKLISASLGAWLDGELSASDAEGIRLHLASCASCDEQRRQLETLDLSLQSFWQSNAPQLAFEPFWDRVRERITEKQSWRESVLEWARLTVARPGLAWAVPAVILVFLAVLSWNSYWRIGAQRNNFAAVDSIDAYGRNVALLREDETKTTVIWLYQKQEGEDDSSRENAETSPSF